VQPTFHLKNHSSFPFQVFNYRHWLHSGLLHLGGKLLRWLLNPSSTRLFPSWTSLILLEIPMVMMILLIARRRAPSLNLMLFSLMRTQQLLDDDSYDFWILVVWLNLYIKKGLGVEIGDQHSMVLVIVLWGFRCQGFEWVFGSTMLKFLTSSWNQSTTRFKGLLFSFFSLQFVNLQADLGEVSFIDGMIRFSGFFCYKTEFNRTEPVRFEPEFGSVCFCGSNRTELNHEQA